MWNDRKVLGDMTSKSLIFTDLAETVLPASNLVDLRNDDVEAPTDSRFTIAQSMELFTRQVVDVRIAIKLSGLDHSDNNRLF